MTRMDNSAVACNDFMSFKISSNMASESTSADSEGSVFQVLEGVVYYVVHCLVCVAAMPLPYETFDNTGYCSCTYAQHLRIASNEV